MEFFDFEASCSDTCSQEPSFDSEVDPSLDGFLVEDTPMGWGPMPMWSPHSPLSPLSMSGSDDLPLVTANPAALASGVSSTSLKKSLEQTPKDWRSTAPKYFLTFPQCDMDPSTVATNLITSFGAALKEWIVAREFHQDGTPHLHLGISLFEKMTVRGTRFDRLTGQHGHYKTVGRGQFDWINTVKYCAGLVEKKSEQEHRIICHPENLVQEILKLEAMLAERQGKKGSGQALRAYALAKEGKDTFAIISECPSLALQSRAVQNLVLLFNRAKEAERLKPSIQWSPLKYRDLGCAEIAAWFNQHLFAQARPVRSINLHIVGPPGCGKTTFVYNHLVPRCRIYFMNGEKDWVDDWDDQAYDLVVLDEYTGGRSMCFLNRFLDGQPLRLSVKTDKSKMKWTNVPVLILGNKLMRDIYHEANERDDVTLRALESRLKTCVVTTSLLDNLYFE